MPLAVQHEHLRSEPELPLLPCTRWCMIYIFIQSSTPETAVRPRRQSLTRLLGNCLELHSISQADIFLSQKKILHAFSFLRWSAHYTLIPVHVCKIDALDRHFRPVEQFHAGSVHPADPFALVALEALGSHVSQRTPRLDELEV